jgi:hypothetical protein
VSRTCVLKPMAKLLKNLWRPKVYTIFANPAMMKFQQPVFGTLP